MSSIPNAPEVGNVISQGGGSAADRYYNYMLMKEKLADNNGNLGDKASKVLKSKSEKEEIEYDILQKISDIKESSPEFAQVSEITGTTDKFEMARELASLVYDKVRAEQILQFYTPSRADLQQKFATAQATSSRERVRALVGASAGVEGESAATKLGRVLGIA